MRMTFLRMCDKCKIINAQRNAKHLWYKYHGLFADSPVVIIVKSCLTFLLIGPVSVSLYMARLRATGADWGQYTRMIF